MRFKAGDLLPNGMIYLGRIDDDVWMVNDKDADGLFTHQDALKHVDKLGMQLLDKTAGMLAYEKRNCGLLKYTFRTDKPYWLSELYSNDPAWAQWFFDGIQLSYTRYYAFSVRPAQKLTIQQFNDLIGEEGESDDAQKKVSLYLDRQRLMDEFAMAALNALKPMLLLRENGLSASDTKKLAEHSYQIAKAMLDEREKQ